MMFISEMLAKIKTRREQAAARKDLQLNLFKEMLVDLTEPTK